MSPPRFCRPAAYRAFTEQLPRLETTDGLLRAANAIAMHQLGDADFAEIDVQISALAERVCGPIRHWTCDAALAHLHRVLFEEEQFRGNEAAYYVAGNSYLPMLLESRQGIPITLALLYKVVAERVGLEVVGVNLPGHFLAQVTTPDGPLLIDAFYGGMLLTVEEAWSRVEQATGRRMRRAEVTVATHAQWLARMLYNLIHVFTAEGQREDVLAMKELAGMLTAT